MFGRTFTVSCNNCNTEFKSKNTTQEVNFYKKNDGICPCCGGFLNHVPLPYTNLTPPPELKTYPRYIRTVDLNDLPTLEFSKYPVFAYKENDNGR